LYIKRFFFYIENKRHGFLKNFKYSSVLKIKFIYLQKIAKDYRNIFFP